MTDWAKDLRAISDFCDGSPEVPSNATETRKKKFKPSLYDLDYSDEDIEIELNYEEKKEELENLPYPKYRIGRGYLIQTGYQNKCVGGTGSDFHTDTTQSIRSVSNIDYSNHMCEQTFKTNNGKSLYGRSSNCVDSTLSVDTEIINEKPTPKQEISPLPLSEILKNCGKSKKFAKQKLNNFSTFINNKGESTLNFSGETHSNSKNDCDVTKDISFDLQSAAEFPSLS